jgi:lipopolysaccharide/colanic/teichoic acid biosynthesis glycosyltransferase
MKSLEKNPDRKAEWDAYQKLSNDPRITLVGRFCARFSIEELPQIMECVDRQMIIVGPRPIMINQRDLYGSDYRHYVRVRPGITGIWQISGRNQTSFATRVEFDVEYVMNWSIWMDIYILTRTLWVVIRQEGVS